MPRRSGAFLFPVALPRTLSNPARCQPLRRVGLHAANPDCAWGVCVGARSSGSGLCRRGSCSGCRRSGRSRCAGSAGIDAEQADLLVHRAGLFFQRLGGRGIFLDQRGVLLRRFVHLRERLRDLVETRRLLCARGGDFRDDSCGTFLIDSTISVKPEVPVRLTRSTPSLTCVELDVIRSLMSFAACDERWASERTSVATTAKPRPASPARAASTAALSASRLVWRAISSITPMMSAILRGESRYATSPPPLPTQSRRPGRQRRAWQPQTRLPAWRWRRWRARWKKSVPSPPTYARGLRPGAFLSALRQIRCAGGYFSGGRGDFASRIDQCAYRLLQALDGAVEVVLDLPVIFGESFRQTECQVAVGKALQALRRAREPPWTVLPRSLRARRQSCA